MLKKGVMILVAVMLFGFVVKAQPSKVDKPTEWKPNTTVLVSANQQYKLSYQSDGNLVVYDKSNKPIWNTKTNGKTPNRLVFQADGNLVLYGANNVVFWASNSNSKGGKSLRLSDQGSLSVSDQKVNIWETGIDKVLLHVGTVKFFDVSKGFGFIKDASTGKEFFVHISGLVDRVMENDDVSFELREGKKGIMAVNVKLL